jgi:hypothetical protein
LSDLSKHEAGCLITKCWNFDNCDRPQNTAIKTLKPCCSELCEAVLLLEERFGDKKAMYEVLGKFITSYKAPDSPALNLSKPRSLTSNNSGPMALTWDSSRIGGSIQLSEGNTHCFLKEQSYLFRTAVANQGFMSGVHYWEIMADSRTENELKIGVTSNTGFDLNSAFCDHAGGYAYYGTVLIIQDLDS